MNDNDLTGTLESEGGYEQIVLGKVASNSPMVGEPIQFYRSLNSAPLAGQIVLVNPRDGSITAAVWNPTFQRYHELRITDHGCERGFPCWVYPGEDPGAIGVGDGLATLVAESGNVESGDGCFRPLERS